MNQELFFLQFSIFIYGFRFPLKTQLFFFTIVFFCSFLRLIMENVENIEKCSKKFTQEEKLKEYVSPCFIYLSILYFCFSCRINCSMLLNKHNFPIFIYFITLKCQGGIGYNCHINHLLCLILFLNGNPHFIKPYRRPVHL